MAQERPFSPHPRQHLEPRADQEALLMRKAEIRKLTSEQ
jgi:hypothetical protein